VVDTHFGSPVLCDRLGATWLVVYQPQPGQSAAAAVLTCPASDQACLDPTSAHDFTRFLVVYLPSLGANPGGNWSSATISATPLDQPTTFDATFSVPDSATWAVPRWTLRLTRSDTGLNIQLGSTCQPSSGPTRTAIMSTLSVVSGSTALAQAVPSASQSTPPTTAGPC